MRPLSHPSIEDVKVEGILHALSDSSRLAIYIDIINSECSHNCASYLELAGGTIARSTLSLQFKALREAGLIREERRGSEIHHFSRGEDIKLHFPGLIEAIVSAYALQSKRIMRKSRGRTPSQLENSLGSQRSLSHMKNVTRLPGRLRL